MKSKRHDPMMIARRYRSRIARNHLLNRRRSFMEKTYCEHQQKYFVFLLTDRNGELARTSQIHCRLASAQEVDKGVRVPIACKQALYSGAT